MADVTLESIIGKRLAVMYREKYPVTGKTAIVQLVAENPRFRQDHYDISYWRLREGGYIHPIFPTVNVFDPDYGVTSPVAAPPEYIEVSKFEQWAESATSRRWWLAYVPDRDMLFIAQLSEKSHFNNTL